ncbi:DUF6192 family protein [Streptomyces sp. NPDC057686]|uniref:DUF6192 family protein n=1 Tax=Streptomyces sp. NPDC057686 TaxID=3346212 RepID=UPI00369D7CB5
MGGSAQGDVARVSLVTMARNDEVAAAVTAGLLRRPAVAAQVSAEDKVRVVEELTRDEKVAAAVTTGLLRRPQVAAQVSREDATPTTPGATTWRLGTRARRGFDSSSSTTAQRVRVTAATDNAEVFNGFSVPCSVPLPVAKPVRGSTPSSRR